MNRMMAAAVRHVEPVVEPPPGRVADVYAQMRGETGLLPPFICLAPHPEVLASVWVAGRETWLAGPVGRLDREVIAAAVSRANECPFCVQAHSMTQRVSRRDVEADPRLASLARWAEASGRPDGVAGRPFDDDEVPWLVGTAVAFHTVNRYVNVLLEESGVPKPLRVLGPIADRVGDALVGKPMLQLNPPPGRSLDLLPRADLPDDLGWAGGDETVAQAMARADAALEEAAEKGIAEDVRALIAARIAGWDGEPALSRSWADEAASDLDPADRPAATLGILTALASFQVDDSVVEAFRRVRPGDADLVVTVVWPAWQAAKRIGGWLAP